MTIYRDAIETPRGERLTKEIQAIKGACIGCPGCKGFCVALLEAMSVPEAVLKRTKA